MIYAAALAYVCLVFLQPTELMPSLQGVQSVLVASSVTAPFLIVALLRARTIHLLRLPHDRFLVAFWLAIGLSNLVLGWLGGVLLGMRLFGQVVYQYVLLRVALDTPARVRGMLQLFAAIMLFHALSGIQQHQTGSGFGGIAPIVQDGLVRIRGLGFFNDPNDLALGFLAVLPVLAVMLTGASSSRFARVAALVSLPPILAALYYTNSRGGMLGLMAMIAVFGWRRYGVRGAVVAALVFSGIIVSGPSRLATIDSEEDSAQGRVQAWSDGLQMFKARPLTGVGFSRFTESSELVAHNTIVHTFAELGAAGGICLVGMGYWYFRGLQKVAPLVREGRHPLPEWHDALIVVGLGLLVGTSFLSRQYNPLLYAVLAIGASYVNLTATTEGPVVSVEAWDRIGVIVLSGVAVAAAYLAVKVMAVWSGG